jgi:hypothetical protein
MGIGKHPVLERARGFKSPSSRSVIPQSSKQACRPERVRDDSLGAFAVRHVAHRVDSICEIGEADSGVTRHISDNRFQWPCLIGLERGAFYVRYIKAVMIYKATQVVGHLARELKSRTDVPELCSWEFDSRHQSSNPAVQSSSYSYIE